jgi:hypothetical protein
MLLAWVPLRCPSQASMGTSSGCGCCAGSAVLLLLPLLAPALACRTAWWARSRLQ